ncbi:uncharacterized protein LOC117338305 [Pecten maximus]|uniref:uncharacterized protein LOC117338305 n=1 Tax=Pecten maximus TaxID=6579 RepID=UPI001458DD58|nr:uncharacterized protein LOC117338305 [Pecten maximus]
MSDQGELYENSWILHHVLERFIGSREVVAARRKMKLLVERIFNAIEKDFKKFQAGSGAEGIDMKGSDEDLMFTDENVIVLCPEHDTCIPPDKRENTYAIMRETDSRPGYVALEVVQMGEKANNYLLKSVVPVGHLQFISSEIYVRVWYDDFIKSLPVEIHGPANTVNDQTSAAVATDYVVSFQCCNWPKVADEWVTRPRFYNWPDQALRDQIVQDGCHLVPVGDKTSADTFLQWRISFVTAERKLVSSLTRVQFLVYGLLKYFLKQISDMLKQLLGDIDIITSYIMKTVIFHAVENTPSLLWQEKHSFFCFMFCLNILISWTKIGYCPNFFIKRNNMFLGKVQGENQEKLLRFLVDLRNKKWGCLSVGTFIQPSIGERIARVRNGDWEYVLPPSSLLQLECDMIIVSGIVKCAHIPEVLPTSLALLSNLKSDVDEFISYAVTANGLRFKGMETFEKHVPARGNKEKYKSLRKSKKLLTPLASICKSPGELTLATYYYQTGNYSKALELCGHMISLFKTYFANDSVTQSLADMYEQIYSGQRFTLWRTFREAFVVDINLLKRAPHFCQLQLHQEIQISDSLPISPFPFAEFLSFLCYHELGDNERRDSALLRLVALKHKRELMDNVRWMIHNILGVCYEMVGSPRMALKEYRESIAIPVLNQSINPAKERIERLQQC